MNINQFRLMNLLQDHERTGLANYNTNKYKNDTGWEPHYSILFDCEDEGFDHIWKHAGIDKQSLIETDNMVVYELIVDIDNLFHHSSELMQEFIVDYVLGEQEFETVVVELSELNTQVKDTYQDILNLLYKIKKQLDQK